MSEIDWSKAPEGATHFQAASNEGDIDVFWKVKDGVARQVWRLLPWVEDPSERVETFTYGPEGCYGFDASTAVARPVSWSGEGLPPVGTVCRADHSGMDQGVVRVEYIGKNACVLYSLERHEEQCSMTERYSFFPIRTPEQIAAEAREKAISEMLAACPYPGSPVSRADCEHLYAAGYRKVEGGAA